ncbi:hypothetical protein [Burkholderia phage vB_BglM_WTB]
MKVIVGAGLAGMLAACHFPDAPIIEAAEAPAGHKALLRFRDESVSKLTGIPFRRVRVHKEVYYDGKIIYEARPPIAIMNEYAKKVTGRIGARSIANLESVDRFVAPDDLHAQLLDRFAARISYSAPFLGDPSGSHDFISTMPLPAMLKTLGLASAPGIGESAEFGFEREEIIVKRYRLANCDAYQTIYFPEKELRVYRASITGNLLIVESLKQLPADSFGWSHTEDEEFDIVAEAFGLSEPMDLLRENVEVVPQKYGKIVGLPDGARQAILHRLTSEFRVYSVGRFATWRNILLDDVVSDLSKVESMLASDAYSRRLFLANLNK